MPHMWRLWGLLLQRGPAQWPAPHPWRDKSTCLSCLALGCYSTTRNVRAPTDLRCGPQHCNRPMLAYPACSALLRHPKPGDTTSQPPTRYASLVVNSAMQPTEHDVAAHVQQKAERSMLLLVSKHSMGSACKKCCIAHCPSVAIPISCNVD